MDGRIPLVLGLKYSLLGYVHTADSVSWRHEKLSVIARTTRGAWWGWRKLFTTNRKTYTRVWPRGPVLTPEYLLPFQLVSVLAPLCLLPRRCANRCSYWTKVWLKNYLICDAPLLSRDRRGAAQLRCVTEIVLPEAMCKQ